MLVISWNEAGKVSEPCARLIVTTLSSSGWRSTYNTRMLYHLGIQNSSPTAVEIDAFIENYEVKNRLAKRYSSLCKLYKSE